MEKYFKILGLNETATKEQVQAAYERKTALYRGSSYEEDPAYARKKLRELDRAYKEAYGKVKTMVDEKPV